MVVVSVCDYRGEGRMDLPWRGRREARLEFDDKCSVDDGEARLVSCCR